MISRLRFAHAKQAICYETFPAVLDALGLSRRVKLNKTDWFYLFKNGSTVWVGGLDDKKRTEKILGNEYSTVFLNEASQIAFESYEIMITRLNPSKGLNGKIIIDYNPPSIRHWGYRLFHDGIMPDGSNAEKKDYAHIRINPSDNQENISKEYLKSLNGLSEARRRRFLDGEYGLDAGKLWRREWIRYHSGEIPKLIRVVVSVDPSGSVEGDEIGIIVAGQFKDPMGNFKIIVLDDYSLHSTPRGWAGEVSAAYRCWGADIVVAEKNFGGDMVASTILSVNASLNVRLITSSRGKVVRAEPVSARYEHSEVIHRRPLPELEDELCTYDPELSASPNRMDALVFAVTELTGDGLSILDVL